MKLQEEMTMGPFDLILFAGQSNMAGRGCAGEAPVCAPDAGWEYRAVSAPKKLCPIAEPFGSGENLPGGIDDGQKKTGSLVSAFVSEYYNLMGRAVVAVSASKGGTSSQEWRDVLASDAAQRLAQAKGWLASQGHVPGRVLVLWCQGETDADHAVSAEEYRRNFEESWRALKGAGAQACGLIQIGHFNHRVYPQGMYGLTGEALDAQYEVIRIAQAAIVKAMPDVFFAGSFEPLETQMKDEFHYLQSAYNLVGAQAARYTSLAK